MFVEICPFRGSMFVEIYTEPLGLSKFNVLLGRNNSGKSAILQALLLCHIQGHAMPF